MSYDQTDQGLFNAGIEYLKTLIAIERDIDLAFMSNDYMAINNKLDVLWMELYEWMDRPKPKHCNGFDSEKEFHNNMREKQRIAHGELVKIMATGIKDIPFLLLEFYKMRYLALKTLIHDRGLRMPKKDDPRFAMADKVY